MANNKKDGQANPETGALTLVLLVNLYRNQMINLLVKNGVSVKNKASDGEIAILMGNLLKVSKSFYNDLTTFLSNPNVVKRLAGGLEGMAQYFKMSGNGYLNAFGNTQLPSGINYQSQYGLNLNSGSNSSNQTADTKSFWSDLNFGDLFGKALNGFLTYDTNKANSTVAAYQAQVAQAGGYVPNVNVPNQGNTNSNDKPKSGTSTVTIVVLSLLGVAVLGTIIYFVARPKK